MESIKQGDIPLTPLGLEKKRPDLGKDPRTQSAKAVLVSLSHDAKQALLQDRLSEMGK